MGCTEDYVGRCIVRLIKGDTRSLDYSSYVHTDYILGLEVTRWTLKAEGCLKGSRGLLMPVSSVPKGQLSKVWALCRIE